MVGRDIKSVHVPSTASRTAGFFKVRNVSSSLYPDKNISFDAARGEILGFAGLVGAGRSEMAKAIAGLDTSPGETIFLDGKNISINTPRDAVENSNCLA